jgi:hypothetical protein
MLNYLVSKLSSMKKLNKKLLGVGLIVLFFSVALIFLVKAQEGPGDFFRVNSASTTPSDAKRAGDEVRIKIINRSGKDYFAPNKSKAEFESFQQFAPKYVSVSVCGDGVCGEGETMYYCNVTLRPTTSFEYNLRPLSLEQKSYVKNLPQS